MQAAPTVCAAATLPRTPLLTFSAFVLPTPTPVISRISLSMFTRSLAVMDVIPVTKIVVVPTPTA